MPALSASLIVSLALELGVTRVRALSCITSAPWLTASGGFGVSCPPAVGSRSIAELSD